jgi:hypothetical protein
MTFAVSSASQTGNLVVRVLTPEEALVWASKLKRHHSDDVTIILAATRMGFSEQDFKAALCERQELVSNPSPPIRRDRIDPIFQAH